MINNTRRSIVGALLVFILGATPTAPAQDTRSGQWATHGGDLGNSRFAPHDEIDAGNFSDLEVAWHFSTANLGPTAEYRFESTPLVVDGVL
jgi:quinoprotein glucose dehydrogenase